MVNDHMVNDHVLLIIMAISGPHGQPRCLTSP